MVREDYAAEHSDLIQKVLAGWLRGIVFVHDNLLDTTQVGQLDVLQLDREVMNAESVGAGTRMDPWAYRRVECPQGRIVVDVNA